MATDTDTSMIPTHTYVGPHRLTPALALALALTTLVAPARSAADTPPRNPATAPDSSTTRVLFDDWYNVSVMGQKVGWSRSQLAEGTWRGQPVRFCRHESFFRIGRAGIFIDHASATESIVTPKWQPLAYRTTDDEMGKRRTSEATLDPKAGWLIATTIADRTTHESRPYPGPLPLLQCAGWQWAKNPTPIAKTIRTKAIVESSSALEELAVTLDAESPDPIHEKTYNLRVEILGLISNELVDRHGRTLKSGATSMKMSSILTTPDDAQNLASGHVDLFTATLEPSLANFPPGKFVSAARFRLTHRAGDPLQLLSNPHQRVTFTPDKRGINSVASVDITASPSGYPAATAAELLDARKPTPYAQSDAPELIAAAKKIAIFNTPRENAAAIIGFVNLHIENKNLASGIDSALEAYNSKSGDCTEHAVLAVALLRAADIPARLVAGLVHAGGKFGFHAWLEAHYDNAWHAMDPTFDQVVADATHIALTASLGDPAGLMRDSALVARLASQTQIDVIDFVAK